MQISKALTKRHIQAILVIKHGSIYIWAYLKNLITQLIKYKIKAK